MTKASDFGRLFEQVLDYILVETGIRLPETKYKALGDFLIGLGKELDFGTFVRHVEGPGSEDFINVVTINETYFFREQRHFSLLRSGLLATLAESGRPLRIWSAACSSGEEAVSLAALARSIQGKDGYRVYATDISPQVLARLKTGLYTQASLREDGRGFHQLLEPFSEQKGKNIQIYPELLNSIESAVLNLSEPAYPAIPDGLNLIFMRNVLMYMPMETRQRILGTVSGKLVEGGCLFVSSSEIPHLAHPDLALRDSDGCYYFQKKGVAEKSKGMQVTGDSFRLHVDGTKTNMKQTETVQAKPTDSVRTKPTETAPALWEVAARYATLRLNNPLFEAEEAPEGEPKVSPEKGSVGYPKKEHKKEPQGDVPKEAAFETAIHYLEAMYRMNTGNLERFDEFIRQGEAKWGITPISAYFRGLAASASAEAGISSTGVRASYSNTAEAAYREALGLDGQFWPARLNLAMLLRSQEPRKALNELTACVRDIETYIQGQEFQYQFLLEGFNAKYFMDLCRGWIRKLQSGGSGHGS